MKRRLVAVTLSLLLGTSLLTACSEEIPEKPYNIDFGDIKQELTVENAHIITEQKDDYVLHKGDISFFKTTTGYSAISPGFTEMTFDCGKTLTSNYKYSISEEMPPEEDYDRICEDCFETN